MNQFHKLSISDIGKDVEISGWLHNKRDHGKILFLELRSHNYPDTLLQCVCIDDANIAIGHDTNVESVITVTGTVKERPQGAEKTNNTIELEVKAIKVISHAEHLPFAINKPTAGSDKTALHRYLHLRTTNSILKKRAKITQYIRNDLAAKDFTEVDTPLLCTPTPEGARDFVIPSRRYPKQFYSLPQSPQLYKQLLMIGGIARYFQIAKCFRDEDSRADRLPGEFTQIDMEMSFVTQEDVLNHTEKFVLDLFNTFKPENYTLKPKIQRITYHDAMYSYGTDKPDLRNPLRIMKLTQIFTSEPPAMFIKSLSSNGVVLGLVIEDGRKINNKVFEECKNIVISNNGPGLVYLYKNGDEVIGLAKNFNALQKDKLNMLLNPGNGLILLAMFPSKDAYKIMGLLRDFLGTKCKLIEQNRFDFAWITDFPLYEPNNEGKPDFSHNPFSMPKGGVSDFTRKPIYEIIGEQYDLVCNGYEIASGAIRNSDREGLITAFKLAGYTRERIDREFSCFFNAFRYGVPPHGGIALGLERVLALLLECESVRDVCAFPLSQSGSDLLLQGPRKLSLAQLKELHIPCNACTEPEPEPETPVASVEGFFSDSTDADSNTFSLNMK